MHLVTFHQVAALMSVAALAAPRATVKQHWGSYPSGGGMCLTNTVRVTQSNGGNRTTSRPTGGHQHSQNQTTNGTSASSTSASPILASSSATGCPLSLVTETTTVDVITTMYLPLNDTTTTTTTTTICDYCNATAATSTWHKGSPTVADPTVSTTGLPHSYNITRGHWVATETECNDVDATSVVMTSLVSELTVTDLPPVPTTTNSDADSDYETTTSMSISEDIATTGLAEDVTDAYKVTLTATDSSTSTNSLESALSSTPPMSMPERDRYQVTTRTTPALGGDSVTTTTYVIDTTVMPITTASVTQTLATTLTPTRTVCATDAPAGETPKPRNVYCGVHGRDVGNYFLAQYVNNKANEPVTLEGCWQFCKASNESAGGCRSYEFYLEPGLDVPRCNLYGSSVAYALRSIDNYQPHWWFDLDCGNPTQGRWQAGHDHRHDDHHLSALGLGAGLRRKLRI